MVALAKFVRTPSAVRPPSRAEAVHSLIDTRHEVLLLYGISAPRARRRPTPWLWSGALLLSFVVALLIFA